MKPPAAFTLEPVRTIESPHTSPCTAVKVFAPAELATKSAHSPMASMIQRDRSACSEASDTTDAT